MYNNPYNYYPYMNMTMNIPRGMTMNPYTQGGAINGVSNAIRPRGILRGLSNIKWGDVLNNTQKTLNVINQAIPVYYQVKPIFNNVKSLGRLISAFNEDDASRNDKNNYSNNDTNNQLIEKENSSNSPTFFIN